jgi:hypothetical protein
MAPVPIDLALSAAIGASLALASRRSLADLPLWRTPALWALVAIELTLVLPCGAYLLWRQPSWSFMYLVEPDFLGVPDVGWAWLAPAGGVGAFLGARWLILSSRFLGAVLLLVAAGVLAALMVSFGRTQLLVLGTTAAFRNDPSQMRPLTESPLLFVLPMAFLATLVSWGMTLWRLILLGLAHRDQKSTAEGPPSKAPAGSGGAKKRKG